MAATFPTNREGLNTYLSKVVPYATSEATRLKISTANITSLTTLYGDAVTDGTYLNLYVLWSDDAEGRTKAVIASLDTMEVKIKKLLTDIYLDIPASLWNDNDRKVFNRKTGLPKVVTRPKVRIREICVPKITTLPNGLVKFIVRADNETKRNHLPPDANGVELAYAVVEGKFKPGNDLASKVRQKCTGPNDNCFHVVYTTSRFELQNDPLLIGYDLMIWVRFINMQHPDVAGDYTAPIRITIA